MTYYAHHDGSYGGVHMVIGSAVRAMHRFASAGSATVALFALLLAGLPLVYMGQTNRAAAAVRETPGDIVFLIDESGSMGDDHAQVRARIGDIADQLADRGIDFRLGLVGYDHRQRVYSTLTSDMDAFRTALSQLRLRGGIEAGFSAVQRGMADDMGFREDAGTCAILITDEDADIWGGVSRADALAALQAREATFFGIVNPHSGNTDNAYGPNPGSLAEATGGQVFDIRDFRRDAGPVLDAVVGTCIQEIIERQGPVADAGPDQQVPEGDLVTLDATASTNPDQNTPLTYEWQLVGRDGPPVVLSSRTDSQPSFQAPDDGTYRFELTVSNGVAVATDEVVVQVENAAPSVEVLADPAYAGGAALVTASFADPGFLDSHTALVDWGDGTDPEQVPISTSGAGWGGLFASHVFDSVGSHRITVTVTDDDGGHAAGSTALQVLEPVALWANSTTDDGRFSWTSGEATIIGRTHTNSDLRVRGGTKRFLGSTEYVGELDATNNSATFEPAPKRVETSDFPMRYEVADYRPGSSGAISAGEAFHDMSGQCGDDGIWHANGTDLTSGLYYTSCAAHLNGQPLGGTVTLVAEDDIQVNGTGGVFDPFTDGLLFLSGGDVVISTSNSRFLGYTFTEHGHVELAGSGNRFFCGVLADSIAITANGLTVRGSGCTTPERTGAPPTLVPSLDLDVDTDPTKVLAGGNVPSTVTASNDGATLLVPGIVGAENLSAEPVTVTDHVLELEYFSATDDTWNSVPGTTTYEVRANPTAGVDYPETAVPVNGTTIGAGKTATWAYQVTVQLSPTQAQLLLDPARVASVRIRSEFTTDPKDSPVRRLFRFGDDLSPRLRELTADLSNVALTVAVPGQEDPVALHSDNTPDLAVLTPGEKVSVPVPGRAPGPAARAEGETDAQYLARLASYDETLLNALAFGQAQAGIGRILTEPGHDEATRVLPILTAHKSGPADVQAGGGASYAIELTNTGSAYAGDLHVTDELAGVGPLDVMGQPTALASGVRAIAAATYQVPADASMLSLDDTAAVTWSDADGREYGPVTDTFSTRVLAERELSVNLTDDLTTNADGEEVIRYQANLTNLGTTPISDVAFRLDPDPYTRLVTGSVATTSGNVTTGNTTGDTGVVVDVGTVPGRGSAVVSFQVTLHRPLPAGVDTVSAQALVTTTNSAELRSDDPDVEGAADPTVTPVLPDGAGGGSGGGDDGSGDGGGETLPAPTIAAPSPSEGTVVTEPTTITAALSPPEGEQIRFWRVLATRVGTETAIELANSSQPAVDAPIVTAAMLMSPQPTAADPVSTTATASFDPTRLPNGVYRIDVVAQATGGGAAVSSSSLVVDGELKLGRFTTKVADHQVGLAGLPLQVVRSYDSFDKASGDFGFGWNVDISDFRIAVNGPLGHTGWSEEAGACGLVFCNLRYSSDVPHYVTVVWPDGRQEIFDLTPSEGSTFFRGITSAVFTGRDGTTSTLEVEGSNSLFYRGDGSLYGGAFGSGGVFDPQRFRLTDRNGRVYLLDRTDGLVKVTDRNGDTLTVTDDGVTSSLGESIDFTRDTQGRISQITSPAGTSRYTYDANGDLASVTDVGGNQVQYGYDAEHNLTATTGQARASLGSVEYGADGRVSAVVDGAGNRVEVDSDVSARQETVTDAEGRLTTVFRYDDFGNLVRQDQVFDGKTLTSRWTYNERNLPTSETDPAGNVTRLGWDDAGSAISLTDPEGRTWRYAYNSFGQLTTETSPSGIVTTSLEYDTSGNLVKQKLPEGSAYTYTYDSGRLSSLTRNGVLVQSFEYSPEGRVTKITDGEGKARNYEYDSAGRVTAYDDGTNPKTTFGYDANGNLTVATDASGRTRRWAWTPYGDLSTETDARGKVTRYTYDGAGRLIAKTDRNGVTTRYEYDANGQLRFERTPTATTERRYDGLGRLVEMLGPDGHVGFDYDRDSNLVRQTTSGPGQPSVELTFGYDRSGAPTTRTGPDGTTTFDYDVDGHPETITDASGGEFGFAFDQAGRLTGISRPNGVSDVLSWLPSGELGSRQSLRADQVVAQAAYTYDTTGKRTSLTDESGVHSYGYDATGRLTSVDHPDGSALEDEEYAYDAAGNRTSWPGSPVGTVAYDSGHRLTRDNTFTYAYDDEGNLVRKTERSTGAVTTYIWDASHLLRSIQAPGGTTSFRYDPLGRRIEVDAPSGTTRYVYDGANVAYEYGASNELTAAHTTAGVANMVLETVRAGRASYPLVDGLGSVVAETDANGDVTGRTSYDAFGVPTGSVDPAYSFTGHQYDASSGLYYAKARYYDPTIGRFISEDPVTSFNPYPYAGNQPCNVVDPTGMSAASEYGMLLRTQAQIGRFLGQQVGSYICQGMLSAVLGLGTGINGMGKAGEDFVSKVFRGAPHNTAVNRVSPSSRGRVIDFIKHNFDIEVKNVGTLSNTKQLRDFQTLAQNSGRRLIIITRGSTHLTSPLLEAARGVKGGPGFYILGCLPG